MARVPTLPLDPQRRNRAPSLSNTNGNFPLASTRPLQITRPPSRPVTPSTNAFAPSSPKGPTFSPPKDPIRPQRSELRSRQTSDYSASERTSTSSRVAYDYNSRDRRDSSSTTRSDNSISKQLNNGSASNSKLRLDLPFTAADEGITTSPVSAITSPALSAVVAALKDAGARKRRMTNEADEDLERERRAEIERQKVRQERIRDRIPGRRATGKAKAGDIDAVLDEIKDEWEFVIDPDFNNVELALSLLDGQSSGKSMDSFRATKAMLSQALKGSVDKHYKAFADALPHHAGLLSHLSLAQTQAQETRTSLQEAKEALGSRRADLVQLWSRGQMLDEMMRLLGEMEYLKIVPDVLEVLISEKRLIQASALLIRSLKLINKPDMQEIGAISDLRSYLTGQETALREILVDELHNHLYLKSFWCDTRWAAYTPNQTTLPKVAFEDEFTRLVPTNSVVRPVATSFPQNSQSTRLSRYLSGLGLRPNDPPDDLNELSFGHGVSQDTSMSSSMSIIPTSTGVLAGLSQLGQTNVNPEADSYAYIEMLLESLAVLGKLGSALDTVMQRLPSEIYTVVEATINEVEERAEQTKRSSLILGTGFGNKSEGGYIFTSNASTVVDSTQLYLASAGTTMRASTIRLAALESSTKHVDQEILNDLFWTVYSKLHAVSQSLRVVFEVSNRIGSRRDFKDSSGAKPGALFPIADVWVLVQAEIRTLLYDYLTDEEQSSVTSRNPITSINEVLREGRFTRDRLKTIFRFTDSDIKVSTKILRRHEDELMRSLRETMPGLVQSSSESAVHTALSTVGSDDHTLGASLHHRLLIKPDPFHVCVLFQPTLAFLSRMADVLPDGIDNARSAAEVLDNFVLQVYLPLLKEKISLLFHHAISSSDAFLPDILSTRFSPLPILKVTTQIMALVNSLCAMLRTAPFHQENYSRLIIEVIIQFYQRCSDRFHGLVSRDQNGDTSQVSLATQWAQKPDLNPCLSELFTTTDPLIKQQLCRQETHLEMGYLSHASVSKDDLTSSTRCIAALCSLYRSVAWFTEQLIGLKSSPEGSLSPTSASRPDLNVFTPFTPPPFLPFLPLFSREDDITLPLSREMGLRFSALLKTYTQLAEIILHTIRIEVRCRVMYYVDAAFRLGNHQVDHEIGEPDPCIVDLNMDLSKIDECVLSALLKEEQDFIFCGLEDLVDHLLIANARHIRMANTFGISKLMRDILALQQGIRTICGGQQAAQFERARMYYSLFAMGPQGLLDSARANKVFSFDEYKVMLDLQCGVDRSLGDTGATKAVDPNYGMYAIELHGLELENVVNTAP
ncbi:Sec8 exocyst complex component-specific domain-containing protein [Scleroderma yunnanense]